MQINLERSSFSRRASFADKMLATVAKTNDKVARKVMLEMGALASGWKADLWESQEFLDMLIEIEEIHTKYIENGPEYVSSKYTEMNQDNPHCLGYYEIWWYSRHLLYPGMRAMSIYDRFIEWHALELLAPKKEVDITKLHCTLRARCIGLLPNYPLNARLDGAYYSRLNLKLPVFTALKLLGLNDHNRPNIRNMRSVMIV